MRHQRQQQTQKKPTKPWPNPRDSRVCARSQSVCTITQKITHTTIFNNLQFKKRSTHRNNTTHNYACMWSCVSHQHMWHFAWELKGWHKDNEKRTNCKNTVATPERHKCVCIGKPNRQSIAHMKRWGPHNKAMAKPERDTRVCALSQNPWRTMIFNNLIYNKTHTHK